MDDDAPCYYVVALMGSLEPFITSAVDVAPSFTSASEFVTSSFEVNMEATTSFKVEWVSCVRVKFALASFKAVACASTCSAEAPAYPSFHSLEP